MTTIRGFLRGLFGRRTRYSHYMPKDASDLDAVVREAVRKKHDGLMLHGLNGGARLGALASMQGLKALELRDGALVDDDVAELSGLGQLEHLDLAGTPINGACLVKIGPLPKLELLDLSRTRFVDVAVLALRAYPALTTLDLSATRVTAGALPHLRELPALRELRLSDLGIERSAMEAFASRPEVKVDCRPMERSSVT